MSVKEEHLIDNEDEDDDIPDLESVASSEYCDSDSDEDDEPKSSNYETAKKWVEEHDVDKLLKEFEVLAIYTYSPFLYGGHVDSSYWDNQWFSWFRKVNLISQRPSNLDVLSIQDLRALEILGLTLDWCIEHFQSIHASLMDLWQEVEGNKDFDAVIKIAKGKTWFNEILETISNQPVDLGLTNKELKDPSAVELCVLYTVCHLGYQLINKSGNSTTAFQDNLASRCQKVQELHSEEIQNNLEKAEMSFLMFERREYIESFRNAMHLSPFDNSLYESRLQAHILSGYHLDAVSDSIRLICLQKDHRNAHMTLIKSLQELNEKVRADIAITRFHDVFPSPIDAEILQKFLQNKIEMTVVNQPFTISSHQDFKKLHDLGQMGTKNFRNSDYENAHLYYGACLSKAREITAWRHAVSWKEGSMFMLSVQYCFAQTLLSLGKHEAALENFLKLCRYHKLYPFPAAHLYAAVCSIKQRRYTQASENISAGLDLCELRGLAPLRWPGTDDPISECLPQNVKTKLLQLQAQLLSNDTESLGTCRFPTCLQHNISRQIIKDDPEFKGYVALKCSEQCSIAFHPNCWKKQKALLGFYNEKNIASANCVTPDCPGVITYVALFDSESKPRFEVDPKNVDELLGPVTKKRKGSTAPSVPVQRSSSSSSIELGKTKSTESEKLTKKGSNSDLKKLPDSTKQDFETCSEQNSETVKLQQLLMKEDSRKSEDSIEVINRHTEEFTQEQKVTKSKSKKKKNKQPKEEEATKENGCKWDDLFTLPERKGLMNDSSPDESPTWEPDPDAPFSVPEHLKEKVGQFEAGELSQDAPKSNPPSTGVPTDSNDYNFAISYFVEIFKNDGPLMNPTDSLLTESLQNIPEECKEIIKLHGGIRDFLLSSPKFKPYMDGMIVLNKKYSDLDDCKFPHVIRKVDKKLSEESSSNQQEVCSSPSPTMSKSNRKSRKKNMLPEHRSESSVKNGTETSVAKNGNEASIKKGNELSMNEASKKNGNDASGNEASKKNGNEASKKNGNEASKKNGNEASKRNGNEVSVKNGNESSTNKGAEASSSQSETEHKSKRTARSDISLPTKKESKLKSKSEEKIVMEEVKPKVVTVNTAAQTETVDRFPKSTNTDPMPVMESFKERYEEVKEQYEELMKEKKSLESKLDVSEDTRVKFQKHQTREFEKLTKKMQNEMKKEIDEKVSSSETSLKEEKEKFAKERKELNEIARTSKSELKLANEKINKLKKDLQRKEKEASDVLFSLQEERENFAKQKESIDEKYHKLLETQHQRAIESEVQLLTLRRESYVKLTEQKLQELERLCNYANQALPGGEPELGAYKDQLKQTLENYKSAVDEQIHKIMSGSNELSKLEAIPPPVFHMSPQLRMRAQLIQRSLIMSLQRGMTSLTGIQSGLTGGLPGVQGSGLTGAQQPVMQTSLPQPNIQSSFQSSLANVQQQSNMQTSVSGMATGIQAGMNGLPAGGIQASMNGLPTGGIQASMNGLPTGGIQASMNGVPTSGIQAGMNGMPTGSIQAGMTGVPTGGIQTGMNGVPTGSIQTGMTGVLTGGIQTGMTGVLTGGIQTGITGVPTGGIQTGITGVPTGIQTGMTGIPTGGIQTGMTGVPTGGIQAGIQAGMTGVPTGGIQSSMNGGVPGNMSSVMVGMQTGLAGIQASSASVPIATSDSLLSTAKPGPATILTALPSNPLEILSQPQHGAMNNFGMNLGSGIQNIGLSPGLLGVPPGINQTGTHNMLNSSQTHPSPLPFMGLNSTGTGMSSTDGSKLGPIGTGMTYSNPPPVSKEANENVKPAGEKGNFDQLVESLSPHYPSYTRDDFKRAVLELRKKLSLTGLPLEAVIDKVREIIDEKEIKKQQTRPPLSSYNNLMSSLPDSFMFSQPVLNQGPKLRSMIPSTNTRMMQNSLENISNEDNGCIICYEEMKIYDSSKLECGHQFHTQCIRSWLNEQSTCPTCRKHALLIDDFPHLQ